MKEVSTLIMSWTRGVDLDDYPDAIRMYDVEIDDDKYYFLVYQEKGGFLLKSKDTILLDKLLITFILQIALIIITIIFKLQLFLSKLSNFRNILLNLIIKY